MAKLIVTAGHVDHGKTTLIHALTGIDADRLPEEKARGMTIDIGFAHLVSEVHGRVSIVDVPGHESLVKNMLVGSLNGDVALLCVAADESVKPQTLEHLQILNLLPLEKMVVAVTRKDLADETQFGITVLDIEKALSETKFRGCPLLGVSATTGDGLAELRAALDRAMSEAPESSPEHGWSLPVDRAFAMKGFGVIVTGTLRGQPVSVGDIAQLQPEGREVRIRGIQVHGESVERAEPGERTALNLTGIKLQELERGQMIGKPGWVHASARVDFECDWVAEVKHNLRVRVAIGSDDAIGKLAWSAEHPNQVQVIFEREIAVTRGQPVIFRRYSPPDILGGGKVVVPHGKPRTKGEKPTVAVEATLDQAVLTLCEASPHGILTEEIARRLGVSLQALGDVFDGLRKDGKVLGFAGLWFQPAHFAASATLFLKTLREMHATQPKAPGHPREAVAKLAKLPWTGKPLDRIVSLLVTKNKLEVRGPLLTSAGFEIALTPRQKELLDRVLEKLEVGGCSPPTILDIAKLLGAPIQAITEIMSLGVQSGQVIRVAEGLHYTKAAIEKLTKDIEILGASGPFTAAQARDKWETSRKYAVPLLEYFDAKGITFRQGESRVLNKI